MTLKRAVKVYREAGPKGFYQPRKTRSAAVLAEAQQLLNEGPETSAVADHLGIKRDTLSKAVRAGRLVMRSKKKTSRS